MAQPDAGGTNGGISDEKYVRLTTWTGDGRPKHTPVWIVGLPHDTSDVALAESGDSAVRVGFTTGSNSWKVRRILRNSAVELQPSDAEGAVQPESSPVAGTARVVHGPEFTTVRRAVRHKYRLEDLKISLQEALGWLRGRGPLSDCAVMITLADVATD
jgi:hypothetical protein